MKEGTSQQFREKLAREEKRLSKVHVKKIMKKLSQLFKSSSKQKSKQSSSANNNDKDAGVITESRQDDGNAPPSSQQKRQQQQKKPQPTMGGLAHHHVSTNHLCGIKAAQCCNRTLYDYKSGR